MMMSLLELPITKMRTSDKQETLPVIPKKLYTLLFALTGHFEELLEKTTQAPTTFE